MVVRSAVEDPISFMAAVPLTPTGIPSFMLPLATIPPGTRLTAGTIS